MIYDVDMLLSCAEMCQDTGPFCFCLLLILRPWPFLLPFLLDFSGIQNKLTRCNHDFWGVAYGCLFIFIFLRKFRPWIHSPPEKLISVQLLVFGLRVPGNIGFHPCRDPQFTTLDLLMFSSKHCSLLPWKTLCTLLQRPCCIVLEFPVISKQNAWFVALYDFLCVSTCKLQMQ